MATPELQHEIEQFLYAEARLLDEGRYRDWLALLTEDVVYFMPTRETRTDGREGTRRPGELAIFEDDRAFLVARIERLEGGLAHAEEPRSRTRKFVSNIEITERADGGLDVRSNFMLFQSRLERTETNYVGRREDTLRQEAGQWKIARRVIVLDQILIPRTISVFF